ncbi:MAG: hypothetical protein NTY90_05530 [Candidatus Micrarchaeota archaeon]|nr:hypothetical protein [Candidatus Micrarchaeota archaeon]
MGGKFEAGSRADALALFGLSSYEASLYRALVADGVCSAKDLSTATGVPYGKVYEITKLLSTKGFVNALPTKPAKFQAVPPMEAITLSKKALISSVEKAGDLALRELEPSFTRGKGLENGGNEKNDCLVIERRTNVNDKTEDMINRAGERVCILASENGLKRLTAHKNALRAAHRRGVKILIGAPLTPANRGHAKSLGFSDLRHPLDCPKHLVAIDGRECLLVDPLPDDESFLHGRDTALWIKHGIFASLMDKLFYSAFRDAKRFNRGRLL